MSEMDKLINKITGNHYIRTEFRDGVVEVDIQAERIEIYVFIMQLVEELKISRLDWIAMYMAAKGGK